MGSAGKKIIPSVSTQKNVVYILLYVDVSFWAFDRYGITHIATEVMCKGRVSSHKEGEIKYIVIETGVGGLNVEET